jgi:hypothetical protein
MCSVVALSVQQAHTVTKQRDSQCDSGSDRAILDGVGWHARHALGRLRACIQLVPGGLMAFMDVPGKS